MKKYLLLLLIFAACQVADKENEIARLKEHNEAILQESAKKDSAMIAMVDAFNEIEENLSVIRKKEQYITLNTAKSTELDQSRREQIVEEIQLINQLMEENRKQIEKLNRRLRESGKKIAGLEEMILRLNRIIEEKDAEIGALKEQLVVLDFSMDSLSHAIELKEAAYEEQVAVATDRQKALNTAWYCYGSIKELKANGVITKQGGFIGIGRTEKLTSDFNRRYFREIDITQTTSIELRSKKARLVTSHSGGSYKFEGPEGRTDHLVITDPQQFWSASKYLVIVVE